MNLKEAIPLVDELYTNGKDIDFVINYLFENKVYYVIGVYAVGIVYKLDFDEVRLLFYTYDGYKESMEQGNPFNEDFINFVEENG